MSSRERRERLAKALEEARRAEKEIIEREAREADEQTERIVDEFSARCPETPSA